MGEFIKTKGYLMKLAPMNVVPSTIPHSARRRKALGGGSMVAASFCQNMNNNAKGLKLNTIA